MDADVVEQSEPGQAPGDEVGVGVGPGTPEAAVDEVDRLLDEVEAALDRLDEGTYGVCGRCGAPIEDPRLSAEPTVRTCAACASGSDPVGAGEDPVGIGEDLPGEPTPSPWMAEARGTIADH